MTKTIRDVARHAQVSVATVSAVLNESKYVSPPLVERVRRSAEELGYRPNGLARSLKRQRTQMLGLILSDITNPFFTTMVRAVEDTARLRGYTLLLGNTDEESAKEEAYVELLRSRQIDGLILVASAGEHAYIPDLLARGLPIVCVDRSLVALGVDSVLTDNVAGAYQAVAHLLGLGHTRIGIVTGIPKITSTDQRLAGYEQAHAERGLPIDPALIYPSDSTIAGGERGAAALLALPERPTALFTTNNQMTIGALRAIHARGLRCPEDIALVGFDDFEWADVFRPRLTTVRQPVYELGRAVARLLIKRIEGQRTGAAREIVLPPTLIVRESCGERLRRPAATFPSVAARGSCVRGHAGYGVRGGPWCG
jgi:LacI family transcriptional regulator